MPTAATGTVSGNPEATAGLPVQLTSFVGREAELAELEGLVRSSRLVTITGGAGLGKTRLAVEVAARLSGEVEDVWFVSLAGLSDGSLVAREVAGRIGVLERPGEPLLQTLAAHVGGRPLLLLLDNGEHLVDATARLVEPLLRGCLGLRVLVTSREPLRVAGEVVWRIEPLSLPAENDLVEPGAIAESEAVQLFDARARLPRPRFRVGPENADAVALLCRRLDGIPLAIELAAARLETLSVEDILARLEDRFRLLTGGDRLAVPRHRTLRAALDWGHQLLDEQERRLFRRVSVFVGGFDLAAAEAVCAGAGLEADAVAGLVFGLVEKSLLAPDQGRPGPTRYQMLETVRQYAAERLAESGEAEQLGASHAAFFVALAEQAESFERSPRLTEWLTRLEADRDDLRASLEWCRANDREAGLRLASALGWFWMTHGYFGEGREWLEEALTTSPVEAPARARALLALGRMCFWQGDYLSARSLCLLSLQLSQRQADEKVGHWAEVVLGLVAAYQGDYEESRRRFEAVLEATHDDVVRMEALVGMGEMLIQKGELAEARPRLEAVRAMSHGPEAPRGRSALFLGLVDLFGGDSAGARTHFVAALDVFQRLGNRYALAGALDATAVLAMTDLEPERALRLAAAADRIREATRAELAPRWREMVRAVIIKPASEAVGERTSAVWAEGERMTHDDAVRYAKAGLGVDPTPGLSDKERSPGRLAGLSPRELEVAELVMQGLTNRRIADRLGIAERTAEGHVERIRNKLGVRSRTQIAVAVVRQRAWPE